MRTELVFSGSPSADLDVDHGETASGDQFLSLTRSRQDSILSEQILIVFPTTADDGARRRQVAALTQIINAIDRIRTTIAIDDGRTVTVTRRQVDPVRHEVVSIAGIPVPPIAFQAAPDASPAELEQAAVAAIEARAGNHFAGMPDDVVIPFLDRGRDVGAGE